MAPKLALAFVPTLPPERLRSLAQHTEAAGLDELWVWEDCFKESGVASAAIALGATETLRVGLGLMPVPLRNVALAAMEIATLARAFPGRFRPGIGHGVQSWMDQVGGRVASPLTLLREYASALRRLLDGEEVTISGRYVTLDRVRLAWPPPQPVPLLLGGAGPRSLALSGELGDGSMLTSTLRADEIEAAVRTIRAAAGAKRHPVVGSLIAATGFGARERVDAELPRWGRMPEPGLGVAGDAAAIADGIRTLAGLGCSTVTIQPTEDEPSLDDFVRFLGQEVRPLLSDES
jgi:5,10-methylenetetrahydromethanopterin reductase